MRKQLLAAILFFAALVPASAQIVYPIGGTGTGSGNAVISPATGNTAGNAVVMSNTTTGVTQASFAPAPAGHTAIVTTSQTPNATDFGACKLFILNNSALSVTAPASSTLQADGGCYEIQTLANTGSIIANAADTITFPGGTTSGSGATVTLPANKIFRVSSDGISNLKVSENTVTGTGSDVRATNPVLITPALGTIASGNLAAGTGYGVANLSGAGSGVLAALAANASGSGAVCLASGSACAGSSFIPALPNYIAGNWYLGAPYVGLATGAAIGATTIEWMPFYVNKALTVSAIGTKLVTASAGQNCQLAIYAADPTTNGPTGSNLGNTGNVSTTTAGNISGTVSVALSVNTYYLMGAMCSDATAALEGFGITSDSTNGYLVGSTSQGNIGSNAGQIGLNYSTTGTTFGTWPTNPALSATGSNGATLKNFVAMFKVGSVP